MSFAANLTRIVQDKKSEGSKRAVIAESWRAHEAKIIAKAVEVFKTKCTREAENMKTAATISFEVLSREIPGFPTHHLQDGTYVVNAWGDGVSAEAWYYATRGTQSSWSSGAPVLFAEVLESMMPKFVEKTQQLGFSECRREPGTWKVSIAWPAPQGDEAAAPSPVAEENGNGHGNGHGNNGLRSRRRRRQERSRSRSSA